MKIAASLLVLLLSAAAVSAQNGFDRVDALARSIKKSIYPDPEVLAKALCKDLKTEREKARALFTWVAGNIRYDPNVQNRSGFSADSEAEYHAKRVKQAYRSSRGVCMDYALMYQQMAKAVGLDCVFISGNSKDGVRGGWESHAWNAVKIDGKWALLDATWGAGHYDDQGKFQPVFQPGYFNTEPRVFALDHFPEEEKWQLLENPVPKSTFKDQSLFNYGDPLRDIQDAEPWGAPLGKGPDGKMELRLKIQKPPGLIRLEMGGRNIPFERRDESGWTILRFSPSGSRPVEIWGGEKTKKGAYFTLMGIFKTH